MLFLILFYFKGNEKIILFFKMRITVPTDWFRFGYFKLKTETQTTCFGLVRFDLVQFRFGLIILY